MLEWDVVSDKFGFPGTEPWFLAERVWLYTYKFIQYTNSTHVTYLLSLNLFFKLNFISLNMW